jgi:hypothetical protein
MIKARRHRTTFRLLVLAVPLLITACGPVLLNKIDHADLTIQASDGGAAFYPPEQVAYQGYKLILTVHNPADQARPGKTVRPLPADRHGITIEGYGIVRTVAPGQDITIEFTPDRAGTFRVIDQLHPEVHAANLVVTRPVEPCPIVAGGWCVG